ncbi:MFS transporter [Microlunatus speluncae]|uniref:MFS transporter n=1 Tax=Microlunatus speluncae TaxID=2594267 RepID=UPI001FEBC88D|nr:MFS transporter [Microlunatus speluncae]
MRVADRVRSRSAGRALWIGGSTVVGTADVMLFFVIAWIASGLGATASTLINLLIAVPRTVLLVFGGTLSDRFGARRMLIITDSCRVLTVLVATVAIMVVPPGLAWLAVFTLVLGVISAFSMPAASTMPRLFATIDELPKLWAKVSGLAQVGRMIGPPLGGVALVAVGAAGVFVIDLAAAMIMIGVLILVRPPYRLPAEPSSESVLRQSWAGLRAAARTPGIPSMYGATALVASGVLPIVFLCLPLLARERGWTAAATGVVEAGWIAGSLVITLGIARWGILHRIGPAMITGPLLAAVGAGLLAAAPAYAAALVGFVLMGIGTVVYTSHLGPLLLDWTPAGMVSRFQALFVLVQSAPQVVTIAAFGAVAELVGPASATGAAAVICAAAGLVVALSPRLRTATRPVSDSGTSDPDSVAAG